MEHTDDARSHSMKGLIVAAGYGTRFLPATKTVPKEMLPLIDTPSLDFLIDEFISAGIREIVIITSRRKKSLEDYFDREIELERLFTQEGRKDMLDKIQPRDIRVSFIRQQDMLGTGHALLQARSLLDDAPFICAYPDDLHFGTPSLSAQLMETYAQTGCSVLAAIHDPPELHRYGVLKLDDDNTHVIDIVEKPNPGEEPSRKASVGRYLYTPELFDYLEEGWKAHHAGEYYHIYALKRLMDQRKVVYRELTGERLDIGSPEGYLRALLRYASRRSDLAPVLKEYLPRT